MKKVANFLAALAFVGLSGSANAQITVIDSGTCGADLAWKLTSDSTFTISGSGDMTDYNYWQIGLTWDIDTSDTPWWSYRNIIETVIIGDSITSIGKSVFADCVNLKSVTIPNGIISIGMEAFRNCIGLTSVTIPNSITRIGSYAFRNCQGLTSLTIPSSLTTWGDFAFENCLNLISVIIENGVTSIGRYAFHSCRNLISVSIPNSVTTIGHCAFYICENLKSVILPDSLISIESIAFGFCSSLTSITIPNSITIIESNTFHSCKSLASVTIGNSVTSIQQWAFSGCSGLKFITIHATTPPKLPELPYVENHVFEEVPDTIPVYIPCGTLSAYQNSEWGHCFSNFIDSCTGLNEVVYNENITVYPNPTTGKFSVFSSQLSEMSGEIEIEIYDVVGRKYNVGAKHVLPEDEITIDISHLASGLYFLKIQTDNGIVMKKVVKQ